jgi:acyl-CoA synthetase (AMP-forming)/AMP-acid ligase II
MATEACNASNSGEIVTKSLPDYGHRPIAYRLDDLAAAEPERALLLKPRSSRPDDGWEPVTRRAFADAVNCAAHLISAKVKADSAEEFPTIAYIGANDIRYGIIMIAAIKAGCQALFISPRNSLEAQLSLFEQTSCRHLWYSGPFQSIIESIASHRKMDTFVAPSVDQLLSSNAVRFPYERPPEKTEWDPAVVLHTSGSTGVPKPVVFRQGGLIAMDQYQHLPPRNGARYIWSEYTERCKRTFAALPFFHGAGLMGAFVLLCLYHEHELAVPIPDQPMTADLLIESIKYSGSESGFTAPSILEELSGRNDGIECLKGLKFVAYGGGKFLVLQLGQFSVLIMCAT